MKRCRRDHELTPDNTYSDGRCKACAHISQKAYRQRKPPAFQAAQRRYRIAHRESENARKRTWAAANPNRTKEIQRKSRVSDPDRYRAKQRRYYLSHPEAEARRRAARRLARGDQETIEYIQILRGDPCCYCGERHDHVDHVTPVASGGENHWANFTSSCARCNQAKSKTPLLLFLVRQDVT